MFARICSTALRVRVSALFCVALGLSALACSADAQSGSDYERSRPEETSGEGGAGGEGGGELHVRAPDPGTEAPPDGCDDGDPCTLDEHPPGYCVHTWICRGLGGV